MEVANELIGDVLGVAMDERKDTKACEQHKRAFDGLEQRHGAESDECAHCGRRWREGGRAAQTFHGRIGDGRIPYSNLARTVVFEQRGVARPSYDDF
jgi:hypothetical protein